MHSYVARGECAVQSSSLVFYWPISQLAVCKASIHGHK